MTVRACCAVCGHVHNDLAKVLEPVGDGPSHASCSTCDDVTAVRVVRLGVDVHRAICVDVEGKTECLCGKSDREAA